MYSDIYAAIEAQVLTVLDADGVQLPNTFIETGNRIWWARITHLPLTPSTATIGIGGLNQRDGITQVDIFTRPGAGRQPYADNVVGAFTRQTQFTLSDGSIYSTIAYHESGDLVQDGFWQDRVLVQWSGQVVF